MCQVSVFATSVHRSVLAESLAWSKTTELVSHDQIQIVVRALVELHWWLPWRYALLDEERWVQCSRFLNWFWDNFWPWKIRDFWVSVRTSSIDCPTIFWFSKSNKMWNERRKFENPALVCFTSMKKWNLSITINLCFLQIGFKDFLLFN